MSDSPDPYRFDPVPSASRRHDGWTPDRQHGFIRELARIGVVSAAARATGMSPKSAYKLLKRAGPDSGFARAWTCALGEARARGIDTAIDRALKGVATPIFYGGRRIGERRHFNDRLLIAVLRHAHPHVDVRAHDE